jgi:hypothetical protein
MFAVPGAGDQMYRSKLCYFAYSPADDRAELSNAFDIAPGNGLGCWAERFADLLARSERPGFRLVTMVLGPTRSALAPGALVRASSAA